MEPGTKMSACPSVKHGLRDDMSRDVDDVGIAAGLEREGLIEILKSMDLSYSVDFLVG